MLSDLNNTPEAAVPGEGSGQTGFLHSFITDLLLTFQSHEHTCKL